VTSRWIIASVLAALALLHGERASAQPPAEETALVSPEGDDDDGADGLGVALMVIGGITAGAGATILVIDAADEDEAREEPGADAGLEGVRGRSAGETTDGSDVVPAVGLGLLVGGTVIHLIGVVIAFGARDDEDERRPAEARVQPILGPTFTGVRGSF
jgi:hypothetical protein